MKRDFRHMYTGKNLYCLGLTVAAMYPIANTHADQGIRDWYQHHVKRPGYEDWTEVGNKAGLAFSDLGLAHGAVANAEVAADRGGELSVLLRAVPLDQSARPQQLALGVEQPPEPEVGDGERVAAAGLDQRIPGADGRTAGGAPAAQHQPPDDRNVVPRPDRRAAGGAA